MSSLSGLKSGIWSSGPAGRRRTANMLVTAGSSGDVSATGPGGDGSETAKHGFLLRAWAAAGNAAPMHAITTRAGTCLHPRPPMDESYQWECSTRKARGRSIGGAVRRCGFGFCAEHGPRRLQRSSRSRFVWWQRSHRTQTSARDATGPAKYRCPSGSGSLGPGNCGPANRKGAPTATARARCRSLASRR
jgi:hypothetical protein